MANKALILVADDDVIMQELFADNLSGNYCVIAADSGEAALERAPSFRPHVVLLDIGLPGMDGYTTAQRLRALPGGKDICLVAVTGYGHEEAQVRSRDAGFDYHLIKPVDPVVLGSLLALLGGDSSAQLSQNGHRIPRHL